VTNDEEGSAEYERVLAENLRYTEAFDRSALTAAPLSGLAILACMDARLDVEEALGLRTGDAHIVRNAGGLATDDAIRSLIISQQVLGRTRSWSSGTRAADCLGPTRRSCEIASNASRASASTWNSARSSISTNPSVPRWRGSERTRGFGACRFTAWYSRSNRAGCTRLPRGLPPERQLSVRAFLDLSLRSRRRRDVSTRKNGHGPGCPRVVGASGAAAVIGPGWLVGARANQEGDERQHVREANDEGTGQGDLIGLHATEVCGCRE
jgi:hypothetical protein